MEYKEYQYKILCEDKAHYHFVRGWLEEKKAHRRITLWGELPHSGSGKEFVKRNFIAALDKVRSLSTRAKTFLIVVIDADNQDIDEIIHSLPCADNDPVFILIAKWSIDTWIHFLTHPEASDAQNETKSFKNEYRKNSPFTKLGKNLAQRSSAEPSTAPLSLQSTYRRVKQKKLALGL